MIKLKKENQLRKKDRKQKKIKKMNTTFDIKTKLNKMM
jgi:hypothetical protein